MPIFLCPRRVGRGCGAVVAALIVTACGTPAGAPATVPATATSPVVRSTPGDTTNGPQQWIQQFCGQPQQDAEQYTVSLREAVEMYGSNTTVHDMESNKQVLYSTVSSGLDASMTAAASQLTASTADAADSAARTFLLGVYQRLHQTLNAAEERIQALPTTDANQFVPSFSDVAGTVVTAVTDSKNAITSNATLGPIYSADPNCR